MNQIRTDLTMICVRRKIVCYGLHTLLLSKLWTVNGKMLKCCIIVKISSFKSLVLIDDCSSLKCYTLFLRVSNSTSRCQIVIKMRCQLI